jgi:protein gp37
LKVVEVMASADWHVFQVLTKRSDRLAKLLNGPLKRFTHLRHIWWGVSVENRKHGLPRIADLQSSSAAVRFLSIEPLLEDLGKVSLKKIEWVIVGGESGAGARPLEASWVRSIQSQCFKQDVRFFFKQWGGPNKKKAGRLLDGRTYDEFPSVDRNGVPIKSVRLIRLSNFESQASLVNIQL